MGGPRERRRTSMRGALAPWLLAVAALLSVTSPAAGRGTAHLDGSAPRAGAALRLLGRRLQQYAYPKEAFDRTPLNGAAKGARASGHPDQMPGLTNPDLPTLSSKAASMEDLVLTRGYPLESYPVETSDGFILRMYRIPHGKTNATGPGPKPVVLLHHGVTLASSSFVVLDPGSSMGFFLADAGFDVWMLNTRTNTYSTGNRYYKNTDPSYWQHSLDEPALIDLPAQIDFTLKTTGQKTLAIVGQSQGGTLLEMLLAAQPEYNDKIWLMAMLGPVTFMEYLKAPVILQAAKIGTSFMFNGLAIYQILQSNMMSQVVSGCKKDDKTTLWCYDMSNFITIGASKAVSPDDSPAVSATWPSGVTVRSLAHWSQMYYAKRGLEMFDYGNNCTTDHGTEKPMQETCNQAKYGQDMPPIYDLRNIRAKAAIFRGDMDVMATKEDIDRLLKTWKAEVVYDRTFANTAHMDAVWARNPVIKPDLINVLWRYAPNADTNRWQR